jgi:hypothetical protein
MAFLDIKRASAGKSKMGAFILASCFIEYMAGFVAGKETNREDYKKFVKDYLPPLYDPEKFYTDLRCKLVHNYSEGGSYLFVDDKLNLHGHREQTSGKLIINLENFIDDLEVALNRLLIEIEQNGSRMKTAETRYKKIGLLGVFSVKA